MAQRIVPGGTAARAIAGKSPQELAAQRQQYREDFRAVKAAVLRQRAACTDRGGLVYLAVVEARREVAAGHTVLHNRPGAWEAYGLQSLTGQRAQPAGRGRARVMMANSSWKAVRVGG